MIVPTKGIKYPPKNKIEVKVDIKIILAYSERKKNTKGTLECSVKNPATNSDSKIYLIFHHAWCLTSADLMVFN